MAGQPLSERLADNDFLHYNKNKFNNYVKGSRLQRIHR